MKIKKVGEDPEMEEIYLAENFDYSQIKIAVYPAKDISFKKYPLSPIKSLQVTIYTTESEDISILHRLHTKTRSL